MWGLTRFQYILTVLYLLLYCWFVVILFCILSYPSLKMAWLLPEPWNQFCLTFSHILTLPKCIALVTQFNAIQYQYSHYWMVIILTACHFTKIRFYLEIFQTLLSSGVFLLWFSPRSFFCPSQSLEEWWEKNVSFLSSFHHC